jgi:hypothetical protein
MIAPRAGAIIRLQGHWHGLAKTLLIRAVASSPSLAGFLFPRSIAFDRDPLAAHLVDHRLGCDYRLRPPTAPKIDEKYARKFDRTGVRVR